MAWITVGVGAMCMDAWRAPFFFYFSRQSAGKNAEKDAALAMFELPAMPFQFPRYRLCGAVKDFDSTRSEIKDVLDRSDNEGSWTAK